MYSKCNNGPLIVAGRFVFYRLRLKVGLPPWGSWLAVGQADEGKMLAVLSYDI